MSTFSSKNSGTSNTVTNKNGKISTNVINWNAESNNNVTKILYELTTNGKSKYAEVSLPTTQLNAITNEHGAFQLDGPIHKRLIKDYSIYLSDLHPNKNIKILTNGGFQKINHSNAKPANTFSQFKNKTPHKNKQYRKTPIRKHKNTRKNKTSKNRK
jgi:hypothetical protein